MEGLRGMDVRTDVLKVVRGRPMWLSLGWDRCAWEIGHASGPGQFTPVVPACGAHSHYNL